MWHVYQKWLFSVTQAQLDVVFNSKHVMINCRIWQQPSSYLISLQARFCVVLNIAVQPLPQRKDLFTLSYLLPVMKISWQYYNSEVQVRPGL